MKSSSMIGLLFRKEVLLDTDRARSIIESGADIHRANDVQQTPLHLSCQHGNVELVELLLSLGADLMARDVNDRSHLECKLLLKRSF